MKLMELLEKKDSKYRTLVTIGANETIYQAIQTLIDHDRGALPVCDDRGELKGIITERDIVRRYFTQSGQSIRVQVKNIMSSDVIAARPDDDLNSIIELMKEKRIRHVPIVDKHRRVIGMVSMRDLLGIQLEESKTAIHFLNDYISGGGGAD